MSPFRPRFLSPMVLTGALLAAVAIGAPAPGAAQQQDARVITGTVTDSAGRPLPYVNVLEGTNRRTVTNESGEFRLSTRRAGFVVGFRRIGFQYREIQVEGTADTSITVTLAPVAQQLSTARIVATAPNSTLRARGFYSRLADQEKGILGGTMITPEDIELRNPMRTTQLLDQINGVRVRRTQSCANPLQCFVIQGSSGCSATVYVDGRRMNRLSVATAQMRERLGGGGTENIFVDELVAPTSVAGIEVYPRGVRAPPEFQALSGDCSVVVIWTR